MAWGDFKFDHCADNQMFDIHMGLSGILVGYGCNELTDLLPGSQCEKFIGDF
jgi:hypothetical protein